jgi:nucleoside triphosphate diphosphatase
VSDVEALLEIMRRLRDPQSGCAWDLAQDFRSIARYTLEEAYEVVDAIERGDTENLRDELGDLLLQVVFHARMAEELGQFDFSDVVKSIADKMVRRHPHVFSDERSDDPAVLNARWEASKRAEREAAADPGAPAGLLEDVPANLPALTRALKLSRRAATVGFEWPDEFQVRAKVSEELAEVDELLASGRRGDDLEGELGDVLFALVNLCRHTGIDPEAALRRTNRKFMSRFAHVEAAVREEGRRLEDAPLELLEQHWQAAKARGL